MQTISRAIRFSFFLFVFAAALLAAQSSSHAQQTRVAYIDAEKLLKRMPEAKDAQLRLDQLTSSWTKEAADMQAEIDRKQADFDRRKLIMTDAERNAEQVELANLRKKHDEFVHQKFDPDAGELFAQEAQLMKPAYDKLSAAIKQVASDGNYDYVIDRSSKDVVLLYTNSKYDITLAVARVLGIESEILSTPLVPTLGKPGQSGQPGQPVNGQPGQPNVQPPTGPTQPGAGLQNPSLPTGLNPIDGTNGQPQQQPGFNSGGYNPGQQPPPPGKQPAVTH